MRIYSAQITKHFSLFRDEKVLNLWAQTEEAHCVYIQYTDSFFIVLHDMVGSGTIGGTKCNADNEQCQNSAGL